MNTKWNVRTDVGALLLVVLAIAQPVQAERVTYIHTDALGSPIAGTDSGGELLWQEYYRPYGDRERLQGDEQNSIWYTGKAQDPDTLLVYMGGRYYNPLTGRFVSTDPAAVDEGDFHSFNRYAYASNSPYRYVDPNGESPIDVAFLVVDVGALAAAIASGNPAAIQSAAIDAGISTLSLFSPIPGAGQVVKAARTADKLTSSAGEARKLYHYTSSDPAKIAAEGLKTGSSKKVFTTANGNLSPLQAQIDLALPPNRGLPEHLLEIDVHTLEKMGIKVPEGTRVGRSYNMPGGDKEAIFDHAIPSEAIKAIR